MLQRSEHIDEWRRLLLSRDGQNAPPGGRQPHDLGIKKTAKKLGLTREAVRRAHAIAAISPQAKKAAEKAKLDNSQSILLTVSKETAASAQLSLLKKFADEKRAARSRRAVVVLGANEALAAINDVKNKITEKSIQLKSLRADLLKEQTRLRELEQGFVDIRAADDPQGVSVTIERSVSETTVPAPSSTEAKGDLFEILEATWKIDGVLKHVDWDKCALPTRQRFISQILEMNAPERDPLQAENISSPVELPSPR